MTVDEATHDKLRQLQDLLPHSVGGDPAVIVSRAIDVLHEKTLARKAAVTRRQQRERPAKNRTRLIPAAVKRTVWKRDGALGDRRAPVPSHQELGARRRANRT